MTLARLAPLALIALVAASCGDKDKSSNQATTTAATPATSLAGGTSARPTTPSSAGNRLAVGKRDLYPLLGGSLAGYASKPVRATSATVVQLAGIDSFWAGRNQNQKVLVKIDPGGRRPVKLHEGQQVSFVGRLVKAPKQGGSLGVKGSTGQPVLTSQGAYIVVPVDKLQLQ
jgi:hypothetical protein